MVSIYNRGDSPARSDFRMARSSSKRSRTSQSTNLLAPTNHHSSSSSEEEDGLSQERAQPASIHATRNEDGLWLPDSKSGLAGLDPTARGDAYLPSLNDLEEKRQLEEKNAEVASWLEKSEAGSELGEEIERATQPRWRRSGRPKPRAHSTGARTPSVELAMRDDSGIPGPGALLDEDSDIAYTEESASCTSAEGAPASPPANVDIHSHEISQGYFPPVEEVTREEQEPLPQQFIRAQPWQDIVRGPILRGEIHQPPTSNAAIYKYDLLAAKFETASRAATWGTRRRLSETDIQSIVSGRGVRKLSLAQKTRERGNSIVKQASKLIPRRASSFSKKKESERPRENSSTESLQKRTDTLSSFKSLQRIPSVGKATKSPPLNTGGAFLAMTGQLAAVGRSTSTTPDTGGFQPGSWNALKRQRSKSEIPGTKSSGTPGLAELMSVHGGPPVPTLVSPMQERAPTESPPGGTAVEDERGDEAVEEGATADHGVRIDLKVKADNIVPNLDGFRTHARQLNPRLKPFLEERIVQEQVRRYRKLVENKVKHTHAVRNLKQCPSNSFCFELGGDAKDFHPRISTKDPEATCAQFQIPGNGDSDGEANTFTEDVVTAALFPAGIPLPPVKRLPAEFECSICFQVRKFQKPSDWTKHVHEDVQPFTCTFPNCSEVRSFKRKADWVRHENERHRHLEWWECNMPGCNHRCYRKDNFVQHLVREHKKREPKVKSRNASSSKGKAYADPAAAWQAQVQEKEIEQLWELVDSCHSETQKQPKDEECKFCGNVCNSWKKLTVHLAKHMEQIAMPVLELVKRREVSADAIIPSVERSSYQRPAPTSASPEGKLKAEPNGLSPYGMAIPLQQTELQAAQSPDAHSHDSHYTHSMQNSPSFSDTTASVHDPQLIMQAPDMAQFARMHKLPGNMSYGPYQDVQRTSSFVPINTPGSASRTYPPTLNAVSRSPPQMDPGVSRSYRGFVQVSPMFDGPPPPAPMYSSPTDNGPYAAVHLDIGIGSMQNYATSNAGYDHNGPIAGLTMPQNPHYGLSPAAPFLADQSYGQNYPYPS